MADTATRAGAGKCVQRRFAPQYLHDGVWWATGGPCATLVAAIARAKTADPDHCNGDMLRVVEVVVVTKSTQVWDAAPTTGGADD